jgi:hypothetical protein
MISLPLSGTFQHFQATGREEAVLFPILLGPHDVRFWGQINKAVSGMAGRLGSAKTLQHRITAAAATMNTDTLYVCSEAICPLELCCITRSEHVDIYSENSYDIS